jgi:hypothetical protein
MADERSFILKINQSNISPNEKGRLLSLCTINNTAREVIALTPFPEDDFFRGFLTQQAGKPQYYRSYLFHMTLLFPLSLLMLEYNYFAIFVL